MATGELYTFNGWAVVTSTTTSLTITLVDLGSGPGTQTISNYGTVISQLN